MLEIRIIHENPKDFWYGYADVIWIWINSWKWMFKYESKSLRGQHRLYLGCIVIWWGMFHNTKENSC